MLAFIDESGHPRPRDPTSRPVILAVMVKESDVGRLMRVMFGLRRSLLGGLQLTTAEQEGKAVHFLNRRAITKSRAKREFVESMFDFLRDFELTIFAIVMERPTEMPYQGRDFLQKHYRWLLERIDRCMEREHPAYMALPIFDGQDPRSNKIFADSFTGFMAKSDAGRALQHIVPTPLFVDSSLTPGIQVADWFAYVIRLHYEQSLYQRTGISDPYLSAIKRYAGIVRTKTTNYEWDDGAGTWYGISTMDATKFVYRGPDVILREPDSSQGE